MYLANEQLLEQEIGGELLLYNPASATAHCLEPTAVEVYQRCKSPASLAELAILSGRGKEELMPLLERLSEIGILGTSEDSMADAKATRRDFLGSVGKSAAAIGVLSVGIPMPAAAMSCSGAICDGGGTIGETCAPPTCTAIRAQRFQAFTTTFPDPTFSVFCFDLGDGPAPCDGRLGHTALDCEVAKTAGEVVAGAGANFTYACTSSLTGGTCVTLGQCQTLHGGVAGGLPCCQGGNCSTSGTGAGVCI